MALICNYITTWTIHNFKSNVNIKSNVNVCDDLSIAFVSIPIQQCNKPYQMLVTPGRGRQRWPAMAICKIQPVQFQDVAYHRWPVTSIEKPWWVRVWGIGNCPIPVSVNPRRLNSWRCQNSTNTSFGESMVDEGLEPSLVRGGGNLKLQQKQQQKQHTMIQEQVYMHQPSTKSAWETK